MPHSQENRYQITEQTGIKVPAPDPDRAVRGLAEAMIRLAGDPQLRQRMGEAGQQRVREVFDWDVKGQFFAQLCQDILAGKLASG